MKELFKYISGQSQFAPEWFYSLPSFCQAIYIGEKSFRWFGIKFKTPNSIGGDTLFMAWRRR